MGQRLSGAPMRVLLAVVLVGAVLTGAASTAQAASFTLSTPYPRVETLPGSSVQFDVEVAGTAVEAVDLELSGLPEGWRATIRGGGFVIRAVTATPDDPGAATVEIDVPADAEPGSYPVVVTGRGSSGEASLTITLDIATQVDSGIELTADFPSLRGDPESDFTYNLTIANNTPEEQVFTFSPSGPQGWTVTASPSAEERAQTVTIEAGDTANVRVTATPPVTAPEGEYPIEVLVEAANGARGQIELTAEVTGTPQMELQTADQRLDVSGTSNKERRVPLIIANSGTAPLEEVKLAGTAPSGWEISFDPQEIARVRPNETAQVTAIIKPSSDAVSGDYSLTVRASAGSESSTLDLRFALEGSRTLGLVAIGVIVLAVAVLAGVVLRFGRR